jgi:hypothetical protein
MKINPGRELDFLTSNLLFHVGIASRIARLHPYGGSAPILVARTKISESEIPKVEATCAAE